MGRLTISRLTAALGLFLAAGCAPDAVPAAPAPAQAAAGSANFGAFGHAVIDKIDSDQTLARLLYEQHVTAAFSVGLLVEPNGYVDKAFMVKASLPAAAEAAVIQHLIYVNFGPFLPGMPDRALTILVPVTPPPADDAALAQAPAAAFAMRRVVLYQPNVMLSARLGATAAPMAFYIEQLEGEVGAVLGAGTAQQGVTAALVMGVKPGGLSRAWVVAPEGALTPDLTAQIVTAAESVPAVRVQNGPVAFAIIFDAWGGGASMFEGSNVPMPKEWMLGAPAKPVLVPDGVFARIWP